MIALQAGRGYLLNRLLETPLERRALTYQVESIEAGIDSPGIPRAIYTTKHLVQDFLRPTFITTKKSDLHHRLGTLHLPLTNIRGTGANYSILGVSRDRDVTAIQNNRIHRYCPPFSFRHGNIVDVPSKERRIDAAKSQLAARQLLGGRLLRCTPGPTGRSITISITQAVPCTIPETEQ